MSNQNRQSSGLLKAIAVISTLSAIGFISAKVVSDLQSDKRDADSSEVEFSPAAVGAVIFRGLERGN